MIGKKLFLGAQDEDEVRKRSLNAMLQAQLEAAVAAALAGQFCPEICLALTEAKVWHPASDGTVTMLPIKRPASSSSKRVTV